MYDEIAFIGIGSNLGMSKEIINNAINALNALPKIKVVVRSSLYLSAPLGEIQDQPNFVNAVLKVETALTAYDLLNALLALEQVYGRERIVGIKGGPRTLDLDLLLYNDITVTDARLTLPHPGVYHRSFVLKPLYEIAPDLQLPPGISLKSLVEANTDKLILNVL